MVTYNTLIDTTQEAIYDIINDDDTIKTYTTHIVDGLPYTQMQRGVGFPYVKIPSPSADEERWTFTKSKVTMSVEITVYATVASQLRELTDAIRKALTDNQSVTQAVKLFDRKLPVTDYNESLLETNKPMYQNTITATYIFIGEINE